MNVANEDGGFPNSYTARPAHGRAEQEEDAFDEVPRGSSIYDEKPLGGGGAPGSKANGALDGSADGNAGATPRNKFTGALRRVLCCRGTSGDDDGGAANGKRGRHGGDGNDDDEESALSPLEHGFSNKETAMRIMRLAWASSKWMILLGTLASLFEGATLPAFSIVFGQMFQIFTEGAEQIRSQSWKYSVAFVGVGVFEFFVASTRTAAFGIASERLAMDLRAMAFSNMLNQEVTFFDRRKAGELGGKLNSDVQLIQFSFSKLGSVMFNLAQCIVGLIVAFVFAPVLTGVLVALSPLIVCAGAAQMIEMAGNTKRSSEAYAAAGSVASEVMSNIRTTKSFQAEPYESQRYAKALAPLFAIGRRRYVFDGVFFGLSMFVIFGTYALALWWGGELIARGSLSPGNMLTAFFSAILGFMGVGQAAQVWPDVSRGIGSGGELFAFCEREPLFRQPDEGARVVTEPMALRDTIEMQDVRFTYPTRPGVPVLRGLSLRIPAGATVAIAGGSGSGKSTIIQLLMRFYDLEPGSGGVLRFDGVCAWNYSIEAVRSQIGLVSQEPVLFSGTIEDNIRYGKRHATRQEIESACRAANAYEFIQALPDGLETEVGERGLQLSGGQKQRIAIARAVLAPRALLLLDEATSALDVESETLVQDALDRLMADERTTSIVVAHRLSTIRKADIIFVLQHGVLVEQGRHDELMAKGDAGVYYHLVRKQIGGSATELRDAGVAGMHEDARTRADGDAGV